MTSLPEPLPGWPTVQPYTPASPAAVELYTERPARPAVVYVPGPGGQMMPVLREHLPVQAADAVPIRDLTPHPIIDPVAQRLVGAGVLSAGAGWGAAQIVTAAAASGTGLLLLALLLLAAKMRAGGNVTNITNKTVHSSSSWWARTNINQ